MGWGGQPLRQKTERFLEKLGFNRATWKHDHNGSGLDRHDLWAKVDDAFRTRFGGQLSRRDLGEFDVST